MKFHEAIKCRVSSLDSGNMKGKWEEMLVKFRSHITFTPDICTDLRDGLEIGNLLNLPFELACNYKHISDLLVSKSHLRPFNELK